MQAVLANAAGVEGNLIAAYRQLDYSNGAGGSQASAASNWIWGSVAERRCLQGVGAQRLQPPINDAENYQWCTSLTRRHPERQVAGDVRGREPRERHAQPAQAGREGLADRALRRGSGGDRG